MNKNKIISLKYLQEKPKCPYFVSSEWEKTFVRSKKKQCWVVKFLADTPPCPGGGDHGKPEAG
ncbi:hypothetical protein GCM10028827_31230 [Mucilaginibacter myungsuensis]